MAAMASTRLLKSAKNYLSRVPAASGCSPLMRVASVSCSTSSNSNDSPTPIPDTSQPVTWDPSKLEQMLKEQRQKDMPVKMANPYKQEKVQCILCKYKIHLDYKNPRLLSQFVSPYTGRVYGRNITRLCKRQQAELEREIAKSIDTGYMAFMLKSVEFLKDPKILDPNNPVRPHNF
ncbi:uncharacterized protein mRpS18C isoform X2 [Panulirus ornatus]|uniref:uncharacterized protein mRpS18C isoform X2 n=1 Tax=Panulirus ornatus TaxID=150431 RepID=UPI003A8AE2D8